MSGNPILRTLAIAASAALLVTALAVPVMAGADKVTVCHKPGTPAEATMEVPEAAVAGHRGHGDTLGSCGGIPVEDACTVIAKVPATNPGDRDTYYVSWGPRTLAFDGTEVIHIHGATTDPRVPYRAYITAGSGASLPFPVGDLGTNAYYTHQVVTVTGGTATLYDYVTDRSVPLDWAPVNNKLGWDAGGIFVAWDVYCD